MQCVAQKIGKINWVLHVKSESYRGLDQEIPIQFEVIDKKNVKRVNL